MIRLFIISAIIILSFEFCKAQNKVELEDPVYPVDIRITPKEKPLDFRIPIIKVIGFNLNAELLHQTPKDYAHITSIAISFDVKGEIDSVYFSKIMTPELKNILIPSEMQKKIKDYGLISVDYKNKVILFPIIFIRRSDRKIENRNALLSGYYKMWPELSLKDQEKKLVLLDPYINTFDRIR